MENLSLTCTIYMLAPRIRGGRPTWRPYEGPGRGVFHEPRVTRDDVVILSLLPRSGI